MDLTNPLQYQLISLYIIENRHFEISYGAIVRNKKVILSTYSVHPIIFVMVKNMKPKTGRIRVSFKFVATRTFYHKRSRTRFLLAPKNV